MKGALVVGGAVSILIGTVDGPALRTTDTDQDEAMLVACAKADRRAFAPLYARYLDPVYRYCYRRLGSKEAAEDATSQVFAKALTALPSYRDGSFGGWLFAIAHNVVADGYRRAALRSHRPLDAVGEPLDAGPSPEDLAVAADERRSVRSLLAELPTDQRRVVELRLAGLTGAEIASALERSIPAVKMLQLRAMTRLRARLGVDAPETPKETDDERG